MNDVIGAKRLSDRLSCQVTYFDSHQTSFHVTLPYSPSVHWYAQMELSKLCCRVLLVQNAFELDTYFYVLIPFSYEIRGKRREANN